MRCNAKPTSAGGSPGRGKRRLALALTATAALALLLTPAVASATEHPFKETFGSAAQPTFGTPAGMAVDQSNGDVLVIDLANQTLNRFKPNGEPDPFSALGTNVIDGKLGPGGKSCALEPSSCDADPQNSLLSFESSVTAPDETEVAVAPAGAAGGTAGDIYVTDAFATGAIDIFAPTGSYLGQKGFTYPCGVAVDPAGNVFVGNYESPAGVIKLIPSAPATFSESGKSPYAVTNPCQVAAGAGSSAGFVFAAVSSGFVSKIDSEGAEEGETKYTVSPGSNTTVTVDPASGHVLVTKGKAFTEYDASGASSATEVSNTGLASAGFGVAVNKTSGNVYVSREGASHVEVFGPLAASLPLKVKIEEGEGRVQSNPAGIEACGPTTGTECEANFAEELVTLTASPAAGYAFKSWKNCVKEEAHPGTGVNGRQCTVYMSKAREVGVKFAKTWNLTAAKASGSGPGIVSSKPGGITCLPNCSSATAAFANGATVEVAAKPNKHFHLVEFKEGSGSASSCNGNPTCSFTIGADSAVKALFAEDAQFALSVSKTGGGQGSIKSKPAGILCGFTCSAATASFYTGEVVTIEVALNKGTTSLTWTTGAGTCTGSANPCTVTMGAAHSLVAKFE